MRFVRHAVFALAALGLTAGLAGQSSSTPMQTSEPQSFTGRMKVESLAAGRTRIQFWLNTPTYLAKQVNLEGDGFSIAPDGKGGILVTSSTPVQVTGFTVGQIGNDRVLQDAAHGIVTWDTGFSLRLSADRNAEWGCCPR